MAATLTIVAASTGSTSTFSNVFVDAFNCEPLYAEDNLTVRAQKVVSSRNGHRRCRTAELLDVPHPIARWFRAV
jgi:hypothetical protein